MLLLTRGEGGGVGSGGGGAISFGGKERENYCKQRVIYNNLIRWHVNSEITKISQIKYKYQDHITISNLNAFG